MFGFMSILFADSPTSGPMQVKLGMALLFIPLINILSLIFGGYLPISKFNSHILILVISLMIIFAYWKLP